jgi:DnaK suppressor protein
MADTDTTPDTKIADEFRRRLREQRLDLFRTLTMTDDELATLEGHQAGAMAEDAATQAAGAVLARLENRQRRELEEIEDALTRLENGVFGVCEGCARPIALARLRAMPAARHCLDCQKRLEASLG